MEIIIELLKLKVPRDIADNYFCWSNASSGNFSIKAAYDLLGQQDSGPSNGFWNKPWKWKIPKKQIFLVVN